MRGKLTSIDRLLQELDSLLLTLEAWTLLVVEPAKLLKNLGMVGIPLEHALIRGLSRIILSNSSACFPTETREYTYILLLLVDMANLEPNVFFGERAWGIADDVFKALQNLVSHNS